MTLGRLVQHRPSGNHGETEKTLSVLLNLESLPDKVILEYVSYPVRAFVPNPLRCFRCQAYGHIAAVCRKEIWRCKKCEGGHGTKERVYLTFY